MMAITHDEVRRHPRWKAEMQTPLHSPRSQRVSGAGLIALVALLIVSVAAAVLAVRG
ncbi:MAG: hypothetical protein HUU26_00015 [Gemmatimonadaceae bacterium]|nr:hypothetical protein [Gemmatimonadaceae bacterium]